MKKRMSGFKIFLLALGSSGSGLLISVISMYSLRVYAPTEDVGLPLLMPIGVIGIIQGIAMLFDFLVDPIIASWGDNSTNPKGRRIPFMRMAFLPAGVFCILVFFVPDSSGVNIINIIWVLLMFLAYAFTRSLYEINLMALLPETVHEPHRRVWFFAIRTTVGLLGTVFLALVPGLVEVIQADSVEALFAWRMLLTILLVISTLLMLPSVLLIKETDYVAAAPADQQRIGIWKSVKTTLAVKPFRNFVIGTLFFSSATGVTNAAMLFYVDVLFGLPGSMSTVLLLVMIVAAFAFFPIVMPVARRVGKRKMLILTTIVCAAGYLLLALYEPLGALLGAGPVGENSIWTQMAGADAQSGYVNLIIILGVVFGLPIAVANLLGGSVYTDIIQYHKIRTGQTLSAMFTAAQNIILALPSTIIPAAVGILIYLGTTNDYPTTLGVQSTAILAIIACIPAVIFYHIYNEREILATIEAAAAQGEVDASETDVQS